MLQAAPGVSRVPSHGPSSPSSRQRACVSIPLFSSSRRHISRADVATPSRPPSRLIKGQLTRGRDHCLQYVYPAI
jgi:hypothetical protein